MGIRKRARRNKNTFKNGTSKRRYLKGKREVQMKKQGEDESRAKTLLRTGPAARMQQVLQPPC